jgi:hypothetical protein
LRHHRIGADHASNQRVVETAVEVDEADVGELLLAGEAAGRLAGGRIAVGAAGVVPLAPGVVAVALDNGERAKSISLEAVLAAAYVAATILPLRRWS